MTTNDSSIQWLQYRLLHRILPVNYYLKKKINVVSSDWCSFCERDVETIQRVFVSCEKISTIWSNLSMHIYQYTSIRISFNVINILLGELPLSKDNKVVNFIILYAKQYLFWCLKKDSLSGLLFYLYNKYKVEKYIQKFQMQKFPNNWHVWKHIFDTNQQFFILCFFFVCY